MLRALLTSAVILATASAASAADVYGGPAADTQTIHHCGWIKTERMIYTKRNPRNTAIIQDKLSDMGYQPGASDGVNGRLTKRAVRQFQSDYGLRVDGIVGIQTSTAIGYVGNAAPWVRSCHRAYDVMADRY